MSTLGPPIAPTPLWRRVIAPPGTRTGRHAAWLVAAAMVVLAIDGALVAGGIADAGWAARAALGVSSLLAVVGAVVAGALAVRAIVRGERSVIVLAPLIFGALCFGFLVGELLVPH